MHAWISSLGLTNGRLGVVTADIVELDSVIVEVVEDGQAELISLTVVGLGNTTTMKKQGKQLENNMCLIISFNTRFLTKL